MDFEATIIQCAIFATDVILLGTFYKLYKHQLSCLKSLQEAKCLDINNDLPKSVKNAGGVVPYAVVVGNVKALITPLRSRHVSYLRGVIYERITTEKKLKWSPFFQIWDPTSSDIKREISNIPFGLYGGGFFKKQVVEIIDPLEAQELILPTVYDDYQPHKESFTDLFVGFFRGEHTVATLDVENMLLEDTSLTAVGKLILENDKLKITQPANGLTYYLTTLSLDSLKDRIKNYARIYKILTIITATGALLFLFHFSKKGYLELRRKIEHARNLKRLEEERLSRRKAETSRSSDLPEDMPRCVICLENPVELVILECGHICLCLNCSEHCGELCPYCRCKIKRLVPVFLP